MSLWSRLTALVAVVCAGVYGALILGGVWFLRAGPDQLLPFDLRFAGYQLADAQAYLAALPQEGRDWYLGPNRILDTVFPLLFAVLLGLILWRLTRGWYYWSRLLLLTVPSGYLVLDLAENAVVADILRHAPDQLDTALVSLASSYTVTKFIVLGITLLLIVGFAARRLLRR